MLTSGIQPFLPPHQEILFQQRQAPACHLTSKKNSLLLSAPTCSKPTLLSLSLPQGRPPCRAPASYRHPPPGPHPVLASRMLSESESCSVVSYIIHGILQARILEWVAFPFSRASSQPRDWAQYPTLQANSLPAEPPGKPKNIGVGSLSLLQWVFLTQELNRGLLHCRRILYPLSYQESSRMLNMPLLYLQGKILSIYWFIHSFVQ